MTKRNIMTENLREEIAKEFYSIDSKKTKVVADLEKISNQKEEANKKIKCI